MDEEGLNRKLRELSHELKLMQFRAEIHESILLRTRVFLHLMEVQSPPDPGKALEDAGRALEDARDQVLSEIEGIGSMGERAFLSSPQSAALSDAEKILYAEEIREIVEHMKTYVAGF